MTTSTITLDDLWERPPDDLVPLLDRQLPMAGGGLSAAELAWRRDGVFVMEEKMPDELIDAYCAVHPGTPGGFGIGTPYMLYPEIRDICLWRPLMRTMAQLVGEPMGLHLNLTGWRSTTRDWHQDDYLNPEYINAWYAAVWIALADVHPDSGPFQYMPGSNRWPVVRRGKMLAAMGEDGSDPDWPWRSEAILGPLFEREAELRQVEPAVYLPKRGDVLIWHGRTVHRGSRPRNPNLERRALIAHYSGVYHRLDMASPRRHNLADPESLYFPFN